MNRAARALASVACALTVAAGGSHAQVPDTIVVTLAEAERRAVEASPLLEPAHAEVELAEARRTQAEHARFLPEAQLTNVWGPVPRARGEFNEFGVLMSPDTSIGLGDLRWFTDVELQLVQPIYTFGKVSNRIDAARHQVTVKEAEAESTRAEILLQVRRLYWGAVLAEELLDVSRSVSERVEEAEARLEELYDEGSATQNDLFKFEIFKYEVGSRAREVETGHAKALEALAALIGVPEGTELRVATESLEAPEVSLDSVSAYISEAFRNRPELRQLEAGIHARRALVDAAVADSRPSFFVGGELRLNRAPSRFDPENPFLSNSTNFTRFGIGLGLDWNLNFIRSRDRTRVERFELLALRARAEPLRMKVEQEVRESYHDVVRARANVEAGREALRASENLLRAQLQTFDIGLGTIEDVIDAFEANVGMTVEQLENIATLNTKLAELSRRVGRDLTGG